MTVYFSLDLNISHQGNTLHHSGDEAPEQVAQRTYGDSKPGSIQGQGGWGPDKPGLVGGVPECGRGVGIRWSLRPLPTQTIL